MAACGGGVAGIRTGGGGAGKKRTEGRGRACPRRYVRGLQTLGYSCGVASPLCLRRVACPLWGWLSHSGLRWCASALRAWLACAQCGVSPQVCPRVTNPREWCGVPVGTLPWSGYIRGLQTLGYSCGVVSPLLPLAGCVCLAVVSEGLGDPRGMCGVPIGTLPWSGLIRGLQTLGYSCGVASPLWPAGDGLACAW